MTSKSRNIARQHKKTAGSKGTDLTATRIRKDPVQNGEGVNKTVREKAYQSTYYR